MSVYFFSSLIFNPADLLAGHPVSTYTLPGLSFLSKTLRWPRPSGL